MLDIIAAATDGTLAFQSVSGFGNFDYRSPEKKAEQNEPLDDFWGPFCFVCGRVTDHFGEHDDLVEQGRAAYDLMTGTVYRVDAR